jgi:hypothetical protein
VGTVPDWMTMPKNSSSARRNAARALAAANIKNISYTAALRRLENLRCGVFQDSDFRTADRVEHYPSSQHLRLARGNGYVELRSSMLEGTAAYAATAVRFTEDQFDRYQLGARAGYPTGQPLEIDQTPDGAYTYRNAERQRLQHTDLRPERVPRVPRWRVPGRVRRPTTGHHRRTHETHHLGASPAAALGTSSNG